jgi:Family of unknown function (DUF5681)
VKRVTPRRRLTRVRDDSEQPERYRIGYAKPPPQHRFRPGHSGNPKGRPKGSKNTTTLAQELLDRKISVRTNGDAPRRIKVVEAILTRYTEAALKGDTKAAAFLFQRYDMAQSGHAAEPAATPEEQEIIDSYVEDYLKRRGSADE